MKISNLHNLFIKFDTPPVEPIPYALKNSYTVKKISAKDTYTVRHPILRAGKSISSCSFAGDALQSTIHLGVFLDGKLIGVASFMKNHSELFSSKLQYQLRGMAVLKAFQGQGLGKMLLSNGENLLKSKTAKLIWCNARKVAFNFYKENGYKSIGPPFDIPGIGTHFVMYKYL